MLLIHNQQDMSLQIILSSSKKIVSLWCSSHGDVGLCLLPLNLGRLCDSAGSMIALLKA